MQARVLSEQTLLRGAPKRRPMSDRRRKIGVPRVEVGIEMHHRDRPVLGMRRPQQGQSDRVVTAQRQDAAGALAQISSRRLDAGDGLVYGERVGRDVANVSHLLLGKGRDVDRRVVGPEQSRRAADVRRAKPRTRPIGHSRVERHPNHSHVQVSSADLRHRGQQRKGGRRGIPRGDGRVDLPQLAPVLYAGRQAHVRSDPVSSRLRARNCWRCLDAAGSSSTGGSGSSLAGTNRGPSGPKTYRGSG